MRVFSFGVIFFLACAATPASTSKTPMQGKTTTLPSVEVFSDSGQSTSIKELTRGKIVVLDLWATWCEACVDTIPKLARLSSAFQDTDLLVLGIDVGEKPEKVEAFREKISIPYPIYFDPEYKLSDSLGAERLPTLFIIDRDGQIIRRYEELNEETLSIVRKLLESP